MSSDGIRFAVPGGGERHFDQLAIDFNGTLAKDGMLLPGVEERLRALTKVVTVTVLTADTHGTAHEALASLDLEVKLCVTGEEKAALARSRGATTVAIGNGRNDCALFRVAGLGIAVIGPEGASAELLREAILVVSGICEALDLLLNPLRLVAGIRP